MESIAKNRRKTYIKGGKNHATTTDHKRKIITGRIAKRVAKRATGRATGRKNKVSILNMFEKITWIFSTIAKITDSTENKIREIQKKLNNLG